MKEQNGKEPADPKKAARRAKLKKLFTILKFVTLILIIAAVPVYILVFHQDWIAQMQDLDQVRRAIADYNGLEAPFIYIGAQIIQIIIFLWELHKSIAYIFYGKLITFQHIFQSLPGDRIMVIIIYNIIDILVRNDYFITRII